MQITVPITVLPHGEGLELPTYASAGAAGWDLRAAVERQLVIAPGERALVPTGVAVAIPEGYEGQVRMRSGLAARHGLAALNAPGTIDSDYRGEVGVVLANLGHAPFEIRRGERIAQLIVLPVVQAELIEVPQVSITARGEGGFGSTGKSATAKPAPDKKLAKKVAKRKLNTLAADKNAPPSRKKRRHK